MFQYYIIFGLLVLELVVLLLLLLPLPKFLISKILALLQGLYFPLRVAAAVMFLYTIDQTFQLRKEYNREKPLVEDLARETLYMSKKFRAERNFYLCTFTFTLLIILIRLEAVIRRGKALEAEMKQLKSKSE